MPLYINTNISSLDAQNNLSTSQMQLQTALQRLSSGLRINSARDDAAGLAISTRMSSQVNGLTQAARNANDGISMSQTASGALSTITDNLQRMRSLAVQAANGTNSSSDRAALQAEITQLQANINQIATQTSFNGTNLLDGTMNNAQFQVGANANQVINISIGNAQASSIGDYTVAPTLNGGTTALATLGQAQAAAAVGGLGTTASPYTGLVNGQGAASTITVAGNGATTGALSIAKNLSADQIATTINAAAGNTGVTATASNTVVLSAFGTGATTLDLYTQSVNSAGTATNSMIQVSNSSGSGDLAGLANQINQQTGTSGISATYDTVAGTLTLANSTGKDIGVQNVAGGSTVLVSGSSDVAAAQAVQAAAAAGTAIVYTGQTLGADAAGTAVTVGGQINFTAANAYSVTGSTASITGLTTAVSSTLNTVGGIDVTKVTNGIPTGANNAISIIDGALKSINGSQAALGAIQNRFTSVISNLNTTAQNLTASRSRIQDTDFAAETAALTRGQILQQAGTAMLAQANTLPNGVLALLR